MGRAFGSDKIVAVFPGQGSEYPGLLAPFERCQAYSDIVRNVFERLSEISGRDIYLIAKDGSDKELRDALNAQLLVFGTSVCYWKALKERYEFSALAGHSLGFYTAAYASGALGFEDAVRIIIEAQRAIEEISKGIEWAMAAVIGLKVEQCEALCRAAGEVYLANVNSATQSVISGKAVMVEYLTQEALKAGALSVKELAIPYPLHSPFMNGIKSRLGSFVSNLDIKEPQIPIFGHIEGRERFLDREGIAETLAGQLERKVIWRDVVLGIGARRFIEIGPASVLTKLTRWIDRDAQALCAEELICQIG